MTSQLRIFLTILMLLGFMTGGRIAAVSLEGIPTPRPSGWAVDLTGTLPAGTMAALNRLGDEVKAQTGAELAVVVVDTTEGANSREFATDLFNAWGIGESERSNGLLVFAALGDRATEIVLGDGVDDEARVRQSQDIMQGVMVPRFRNGDASGAVLHGTIACANQILGAATTVDSEAQESSAGPGLSAGGPSPSQWEAMRNPPPAKPVPGKPGRRWRLPWGPVLWVALFGVILFISRARIRKMTDLSPPGWNPPSPSKRPRSLRNDSKNDALWQPHAFHYFPSQSPSSEPFSGSSSDSSSSDSDFGGGASSGEGASGEW